MHRARLALYLQTEFPEDGISIDVEYIRLGERVKRLRLPDECIRRRNRDVDPAALADIIVHCRGEDGPNILVVELEKTSNPAPHDCDRIRVHAFLEQLEYEIGVLIECETRQGWPPPSGSRNGRRLERHPARSAARCVYARNAMIPR